LKAADDAEVAKQESEKKFMENPALTGVLKPEDNPFSLQNASLIPLLNKAPSQIEPLVPLLKRNNIHIDFAEDNFEEDDEECDSTQARRINLTKYVSTSYKRYLLICTCSMPRNWEKKHLIQM